MAVTEIRLGPQQLGGCVALSAAAGWNQNAADWQLMLELGEGWGLALADGTLVASTLVLPYGSFAWISMVLVLPGYRRQGFASRLLAVAINHLERQGRTAVLDATPAGREVYRQHGFCDCWTFKRYVMHRGTDPRQSPVRLLRESDWPWIRDLDRAAFGGDRERLLRALARRVPAVALAVERQGFVVGRDGREARQIGPLVANNSGVARALFEAAAARVPAPCYVDIADHAILDREGLALQRPFTRMVRGAARLPGDESKVCLVAGPELG